MSKVTIIGDIHCKLENLDKVKLLFQIIEDLGNPTILLGDLLDTKDIVRARCLNLYYQLLSESKLNFAILCGNHDLINVDRTDHALEPLKALKNVEIVDHGKIVSLGNPFIPSTEKMFFLPYVKDQEVLRRELAHARKNNVKYVFGHLDVFGMDYGNGIISQEGLNLEDFEGFKRVISGHYHRFQEKENLTYLGTPFSHSFGESDQIKYIGVLDTETGELELLETPFPKHRTFEIDCDAQHGAIIIDKEDYSRLILTGKSENIKMIPRWPGVKYIEKPTANQKKFEIDETLTHEQQFRRWSDLIKKYDRETTDLGAEILKNV
jgi:DNA repair exonuclease SbcCD nuclease subunit